MAIENNRSHLLIKTFLGVALACAVAVVILLNIAGAGLLVRLMVYAFFVGMVASASAAAVSFGSGASKRLEHACRAVFGAYLLAGVWVVVWVMIVKPPFG